MPVFSSKEHSSLLCKNQNKSLTLSYSVGNFEFPEWIEFYISVSSTGPSLIAATLVFFFVVLLPNIISIFFFRVSLQVHTQFKER